MNKIYDIAVIGAGPAGIATACEAVILGVKDVILFEKSANHSDTIRKYFKDNKPVDKVWKGIDITLQGNINFDGGTKESTLDLFKDSLDKHLIDAKFHTEVSGITKTNDLFEILTNTNETYSAKNVIIAIGKMGKPNKPEYKIPKSLSKIVNFNILDCPGNEEVLVVGGGDSALEAACSIAELEKPGLAQPLVTISYRKDSFGRAKAKNRQRISQAEKNGQLRVLFSSQVKTIDKENVILTLKDRPVKLRNQAIVVCAGGILPTGLLKEIGVKVEMKYGTE